MTRNMSPMSLRGDIQGKSYILTFTGGTLFLATSVDVERAFNRGRLLLFHVRSRLSVQSTHR